MKKCLAAGLAVLMSGGPVYAVDKPFSVFLAGAYPFALGTTSQWMGGQYGILGGFTYKDSEWPLGLQMEGMNYHFGFNDRAEQFASSEGYMQITAGTANVTWSPANMADDVVRPRTIGGIGVYNRVIRTTEERLTSGTCYDPWWGYYPCAGTGTVITSSNSQTKFGFNVGASVEYDASVYTTLFLELRYHQIYTSDKITQFMPINFGIRW